MPIHHAYYSEDLKNNSKWFDEKRSHCRKVSVVIDGLPHIGLKKPFSHNAKS